MSWILVFLGGGLGSLFRYGIGRTVSYFNIESQFPIATLLANILSCFLFASSMLWLIPRVQHQQQWQFLLITGVCGGFSTFSTFSYETWQLIQRQEYWFAIINVLISLLSCLLIFAVLAKKINS